MYLGRTTLSKFLIQQRAEIVRARDAGQLLDQELRERGAPEIHGRDSSGLRLQVFGFGAASAAWNTRLARMSDGAMELSSSAVRRRSRSANSRLAWRSRARSSALRTLRALAKFGCPVRCARYSANASRAPAAKR